MSTATLEKTGYTQSLEAAKAALRAQFSAFIDSIPESTVMQAATLSGDKALMVMLEKPSKPLSLKARNQIAINKMKSRAFETLTAAYHFLDAHDVGQILGVSKQALSKKAKLGYVIAYTHNRRKYFPDFQFENNKEKPTIAKLVQALALDLHDDTQANILINFLAQSMDFSTAGGQENLVPRHTMIDNDEAFPIIVRDFKNRLEMGK